MSESVTIARPYAKAIFEYALAEQKLASWSEALQILAEAASTPLVQNFITNPEVRDDQQTELLLSIFETIDKSKAAPALVNLLALLQHNKRLLLLPDIKVLYESYREEQEKTLAVDVFSFAELTKTQLQQLSESLRQRLKRDISITMKIDSSLIGGAVIRAGDLVIDGSVLRQLDNLGASLAAA